MKITVEIVKSNELRVYPNEVLEKALKEFVEGPGISYISSEKPEEVFNMRKVVARVDAVLYNQERDTFVAEATILHDVDRLKHLLEGAKCTIHGMPKSISCLVLEPKN